MPDLRGCDRQPSRAEFANLLERRLYYLYQTAADSANYRVLDGVEELLPRLLDDGYLRGIVTGNLEAAAHIKSHRAKLNRFFSLGGYGSDATDRGELTGSPSSGRPWSMAKRCAQPSAWPSGTPP